jgi:hypothetical protein
MVQLRPEKAALRWSSPGDSVLFTLTRVDFIGRSPGISCEKTSGQRRTISFPLH